MKKRLLISPSHSLLYAPWRDLSPADRRKEIVRYAQKQSGRAVTLNLHSDFEALIATKPNPMREVSKRVNKELKKVDLHSLPIMLVLEATRPEGRLHLHGVFLASPLQLNAFQRALRTAVGYIEGRSGSRQFLSKPLYDAKGWSNYLAQDCSWTRRILKLPDNNDLFWTSHSMTAAVRDNYEQVRRGQITPANTNSRVATAS